MNARQGGRTRGGEAWSCHPHTTQSTLLNRNSQNPQLRLNFLCEPTIHDATTVTTMAGHWSKSSIAKNTPSRVEDPAMRSALPADERSYHTSRSAHLSSLFQSSHARAANDTSHSARTASSAPTSLCPFQLFPQTCA